MTGSWSLSQTLTSAGLVNFGWSMGGMPSRGGPPDWISESGICVFEKSVFQPRVEKASPLRARGVAVGTTVDVGAAVAGAAGADVPAGAAPGATAAGPEHAARAMSVPSPTAT